MLAALDGVLPTDDDRSEYLAAQAEFDGAHAAWQVTRPGEAQSGLPVGG